MTDTRTTTPPSAPGRTQPTPTRGRFSFWSRCVTNRTASARSTCSRTFPASREGDGDRRRQVDRGRLHHGQIDTHRTADVRAVLLPLTEFSDKHGVAVIGLTHPSKAATKAMNAATGSQGFIAAARAGWMFLRETDEEGQETGRTMMLPIKNNLSPLRNNGLAYRIASFDFGNGISAPYVTWERDPVTITADQALASSMDPGSPSGEGDDLVRALQFIEEEFLASERIEASDLAARAQKAGISPKTLRTARRKLGVETKAGRVRSGVEILALPDPPILH